MSKHFRAIGRVLLFALLLSNWTAPFSGPVGGSTVVHAATAFFGGSGTPSDPYQIATAAQLHAVRDHLAASYVLMNDIDLTDYLSASGAGYNDGHGWVPIGTNTTPFVGHFNGKGHVIAHLTMDNSARFVGLFGYAAGSIENVELRSVDITNDNISGSVGAVAGNNYGTLRNVYVTGEASGESTVGGLVGYGNSSSVVENVYANVDVTGYDVGGLIANVTGGTIINAYAGGDVSAYRYAGGLVGRHQGGSITDAYADGNVSSLGPAGGLVGLQDAGATVTGSYTTHPPLIGSASGTVSLSYAGLPDSGMKQQATYVGWDFTNTWGIDEGNGTPYLQPVLSAALASSSVNDTLSVQGDVWYSSLDEPFSLQYTMKNQANAPVSTVTSETFTGVIAVDNRDLSTAALSSGSYTLDVTVNSAVYGELVSKTLPFIVDHEPPTIQIGTNGSETYAKTASSIVTITDSGSGLEASSLKYVWTQSADTPGEDAGWTVFASNDSLTKSNADGDWFLHIEVTDQVGGTARATSNRFRLDNTAPSVHYNPYGLSGYLHSVSTVVTVDDSLSGVDTTTLQYAWSHPGASSLSWEDFTNGDTLTQNSPDGQWVLNIAATDHAGNTKTIASSTFAIDNTPPVISFETDGNEVLSYLASTKVNVSDAESGIDYSALNYVWTQSASPPGDGAAWTAFTNGDTLTKFGTDGDWYLHIRAGDQAGNTSEIATSRFNLKNLQLAFSGGDGTTDHPYQIETAAQLDLVRNLPFANYVLLNDMDMSDYLAESGAGYNGGNGWQPIGSEDSPFSGTFDGGGHVIEHVTLTATEDYAGLFGLSVGTIANIGMEHAAIVMDNDHSLSAGVLIGSNQGTIRHSYANGAMSGKGFVVGGLVGNNEGEISDSTSSVAVTGSGNIIGGFTGVNNGSVTNAYAEGDMNITEGGYIGGFVGENDSAITDAYASGDLNITEGAYIGGFAGASGGPVTYVHASGDVEVAAGGAVGGLLGVNFSYLVNAYAIGDVELEAPMPGGGYVGGLAGFNVAYFGDAGVTRSYATGDVNGGSGVIVGGLVAHNNYGAFIESAYATGDVSGVDNYVGGLVGQNAGGSTIMNGYATGSVSVEGSSLGGGLIGELTDGSVTDSYSSQAPLVASKTGGTISDSDAKSLSDMKMKATFSGWDFANTWGIDEGEKPPYLLPSTIEVELESDIVKDTLTVQGMSWSGGFGEPDSFDYIIKDASNEAVASETVTSVTYMNQDHDMNWNQALSVAAQTDGQYTLEVSVKGSAITSDPLSFTVDHTAPVVNIQFLKEDLSVYTSGSWTSQSVTASIHASDASSGLHTLEVSTDNGITWQPYSEPVAFAAEGSFVLMTRATDNVGNTVTSSYAVEIDRSAPTVLFSPDGNGAQEKSVSAAVTVSDNGSGVDASSLQYIWTDNAGNPGSGAAWKDFVNGDTLTLSGENGEWFLHIQGTDTLGNPVMTVSNPFQLHEGRSGSSTSSPSQDVPSDWGTATTTEQNGQRILILKLDSDKLQATLATADEQDTVTVPVSENVDRVTVVIKEIDIRRLQDKQAVLAIETPIGNYKLPSREIDLNQLTEQFGGQAHAPDLTILVTIGKNDETHVKLAKEASKKEGFTLVVAPVDFSVSVTDGNKTVNIDHFSVYVEREIPLPDPVEPSQITTAAVLNPDGTTRPVPTKIILRDGNYYAVINSMTNSSYVLLAHSVSFADVDVRWAQDAINNLASRMIVSGVDETQFKPQASISRAEFAAIVVRSLGLANGSSATVFSDVLPTAWYAEAVTQAEAYGIIQGYNDGTFRPNQTVTREEAMIMIAQAMKLAGIQLQDDDSMQSETWMAFTDQQDISPWAKPAVSAVVQTELVRGNQGMLLPKNNITRAETAVIIERLLMTAELI